MSRTGGLGRGLSALLPPPAPGRSGLLDVPLMALTANPRQPRSSFDEAALAALTASIREVGVLQPVLVRPVGSGRYELIAGERRVRAARRAGLRTIPALLRQADDEALVRDALVENVHRADLNPLEEAAAYRQLLDDFHLTHEALARKVGKSRASITNSLRLLSLAAGVQRLMTTGTLSAGHARALLSLPEAAQERVAQRVVAEDLSVRATEELVGRAATDTAQHAVGLARAAHARASSPYEGLQRRLRDALATRVAIRGTARRGRVVIDYAGTEDLERILGILGRGSGVDLLSE